MENKRNARNCVKRFSDCLMCVYLKSKQTKSLNGDDAKKTSKKRTK